MACATGTHCDTTWGRMRSVVLPLTWRWHVLAAATCAVHSCSRLRDSAGFLPTLLRVASSFTGYNAPRRPRIVCCIAYTSLRLRPWRTLDINGAHLWPLLNCLLIHLLLFICQNVRSTIFRVNFAVQQAGHTGGSTTLMLALRRRLTSHHIEETDAGLDRPLCSVSEK